MKTSSISTVILSGGEVLRTAVLFCEAVPALRSSEPKPKDLVCQKRV